MINGVILQKSRLQTPMAKLNTTEGFRWRYTSSSHESRVPELHITEGNISGAASSSRIVYRDISVTRRIQGGSRSWNEEVRDRQRRCHGKPSTRTGIETDHEWPDLKSHRHCFQYYMQVVHMRSSGFPWHVRWQFSRVREVR